MNIFEMKLCKKMNIQKEIYIVEINSNIMYIYCNYTHFKKILKNKKNQTKI